jgi:hypothetical protein
MKLTASLLFLYLSLSANSSAFVPTPCANQRRMEHVRHVPTALHQTDPERKRDKVRSLIVNTASKAASLSKSVLNKGGAPIANVLIEAATEGGGIASEKLIEVLNKIEVTLDRVEGEVNSLRGELRGIRNTLVSSTAGDANQAAYPGEGAVSTEHFVEAMKAQDDGSIEIESTANLPTETVTLTTDLSTVDLSTLKYEDIDYSLTEMAPPFITEDECLVPGEPLVRVEKAPQNSRRIFAGIDIPVSVDEVWNVSFGLIILHFVGFVLNLKIASLSV